jgi:hypothetical protein
MLAQALVAMAAIEALLGRVWDLVCQQIDQGSMHHHGVFLLDSLFCSGRCSEDKL